MRKKVFDNMTRKIITVQWTDNLTRAYEKMKRAQIRHLVVIDNTGYAMGVISDRDFQRAQYFGKFDQNQTVKDYMSWPIETIDASMELKDAAHRMIEKKISALLVVEDDETMGIITHEDLLKAFVHLIEGQSDLRGRIEGFIYNSPVGELINELNAIGI